MSLNSSPIAQEVIDYIRGLIQEGSITAEEAQKATYNPQTGEVRIPIQRTLTCKLPTYNGIIKLEPKLILPEGAIV